MVRTLKNTVNLITANDTGKQNCLNELILIMKNYTEKQVEDILTRVWEDSCKGGGWSSKEKFIEVMKQVEDNVVLPGVIKCEDCNDKQVTREADGGVLICHCFDKD